MAPDSSSDPDDLYSVFRALLARRAVTAPPTLGKVDANQSHRAVPVFDDRISSFLEQVIHSLRACLDHADLVSKFLVQVRAGPATSSVGRGFDLSDSAPRGNANSLEGVP